MKKSPADFIDIHDPKHALEKYARQIGSGSTAAWGNQTLEHQIEQERQRAENERVRQQQALVQEAEKARDAAEAHLREVVQEKIRAREARRREEAQEQIRALERLLAVLKAEERERQAEAQVRQEQEAREAAEAKTRELEGRLAQLEGKIPDSVPQVDVGSESTASVIAVVSTNRYSAFGDLGVLNSADSSSSDAANKNAADTEATDDNPSLH
jgi:hypothetical protein